MSMANEDRSILIAGASQGIGEGIASSFAAAGWRVIIGGRNAERLDATARRLTEATGGAVTAIPGDYAAADDIEAVLDGMTLPDAVVACYGDTDTPPGYDTSDADWDRLMALNLSGPARLARAAARRMADRGTGGSIVFIGSICGHEALGAPIAYNVGKAGLRAVVKTMARELGPVGVRVNMVSPGNIYFEGGRWAAKRAADPARIDALLQSTVPLNRFGTPQDIAEAVLFLCSDKAGFITGADLVVDGGQTVGF